MLPMLGQMASANLFARSLERISIFDVMNTIAPVERFLNARASCFCVRAYCPQHDQLDQVFAAAEHDGCSAEQALSSRCVRSPN